MRNVRNELPVAESLSAYIERNADSIYVWERVGRKWGKYALSELPPQLAMRHAMRILLAGRITHRAKNSAQLTVSEREDRVEFRPGFTNLPGILRDIARLANRAGIEGHLYADVVVDDDGNLESPKYSLRIRYFDNETTVAKRAGGAA